MVQIRQNFFEHEQSSMLSAVLKAEILKRLGQRLIKSLMVYRAIRPLICLLHCLIVIFDQSCREFCEENGAAVSKYATVLLGAVSHYSKVSV